MVRCPDEPLLAQVCADRALRRLDLVLVLVLVLVAPTVATASASASEVVTALRAAGYLPMPEAAGAVVELVRGQPQTQPRQSRSEQPDRPPAQRGRKRTADGPRLARATPASRERQLVDEHAQQITAVQRDLLVDALTSDGAVGIKYVTVVGTRSHRALSAPRLLGEESGKDSLRGACAPDGEERTFRLDRVVSVSPVAIDGP